MTRQIRIQKPADPFAAQIAARLAAKRSGPVAQTKPETAPVPSPAARNPIAAMVSLMMQAVEAEATEEPEAFDAAEFFHDLEERLAAAGDESTVEEVWNDADPEGTFDGDDINLEIAMKVKHRRLSQLSPLSAG